MNYLNPDIDWVEGMLVNHHQLPAEMLEDYLNAYFAVSYTHLRAHETVLDLVCRLLLEKKKSNTQHARHMLTPL